MPGNLDAILNVAIPMGIFAFIGFKIYLSVQDPADRLFAFIKEKLTPQEQEIEGNMFEVEFD